MIETKVQRLEETSVDVMLEYLTDSKPTKLSVDKARLGLGAFANVQRRKSAENAKAALELMALRESRPTPFLPGPSTLEAGSSTQSQVD